VEVVGGDEADLVVPGASSPTVGPLDQRHQPHYHTSVTHYTPKLHLRPSLSEEAEDG
jgi:hypothetical protein